MAINPKGFEVDEMLAATISKIALASVVQTGITIAPGGSAGQVYKKFSGTDFDAGWQDVPVTPILGDIDGGTAGTVYGGGLINYNGGGA